MARKKKLEPEEISAVQPSATVVAELESSREPLEIKRDQEPAKKRISFALTDAGQIDWEAMQGENKQRLIDAIKNSAIPGVEIQQKPAFSKETLTFAIQGIGMLEARVASTKLAGDIPYPIARAIFQYNEQECDKLSEAAQAVLVKYEALNSLKYKEEIDLAGMMVMLFLVKLQVAADAKKKWVEAGKPDLTVKPNGGQRIPVPAGPDAGMPGAGGTAM
jgi:hypothetical protein